MKNKYVLLFLLGIGFTVHAQERNVTISEAIKNSLENSKTVKSAEAAKKASELRVRSTKNGQLPDVSVSANYMQLIDKGNLDFKLPIAAGEGGTSVSPDHIMYGTGTVSVPVFGGFKLRNAVKQSELAVDLSSLMIESNKEDVAWQTINVYFGIFKTLKTIEVLEQNLKQANQRVTDFKNFLDNGIIAKNDFLRTQLQASNVELSLEEAKTNYNNLNLRLNILMGTNESEQNDVKDIQPLSIEPSLVNDLSHRKDLQALDKKNEIADKKIAITKGNYYPQLGLNVGYMAFDIDKVMTMTNAINAGVGIKYDLSSLYKNKTEVAIAKAEKLENEMQILAVKDQASIALKEVVNNYQLAKKKNRVYQEALIQANENYRIVKDKYDNGLADTDDLLQADVQQLQAEINTIIGMSDEQLVAYQYAYITGDLLENIQ